MWSAIMSSTYDTSLTHAAGLGSERSPAANGTGTTLTLSGSGSGTVTADGSGNYTFSGLSNGTYVVTPQKTGFVFTPATQTVTITNASSSSVNFTIASAPTGLAIDVNVSADQPSSAVTTVALPSLAGIPEQYTPARKPAARTVSTQA